MSLGLLANAVRNGQFVVTAECAPPRGTGSEQMKSCAAAVGAMVHALSVPENEDGVRMSGLAACGHLVSAGAEPILHLLTRDMNRIALQSAILGAASMGIGNVLCTGGRHQVLTSSRDARGVFDVDPVQLLAIADAMRKKGELADGQALDAPVELLLGTDTNPFADPMELQVLAMEKAVAAGADFVVTQPVFNLGKFSAWIELVRGRKLHERTCIIASVMPLTSAQQAAGLAEKFSHIDIDDETVKRLDSASDPKAAGIGFAVETIASLKATEGVRGIYVMTGEDFGLAKDVLTASGLARS